MCGDLTGTACILDPMLCDTVSCAGDVNADLGDVDPDLV